MSDLRKGATVRVISTSSVLKGKVGVVKGTDKWGVLLVEFESGTYSMSDSELILIEIKESD